jgi:hypothetical protein
MSGKTGGNSPCPCGSGRKYRNCCLARRSEERGGSWKAEAAAALVWEADVFPMAVQDDEPHGRPTMTLVTAAGYVVEMRTSVKPLGEVSAIASQIEGAVVAAAASLGNYPVELVVRHETVGAALAKRLSDRSVRVRSGALVDWELAARTAHSEITRTDLWPTLSAPDSWFAWGIGTKAIARFFDAVAALFRAAGRDQLVGYNPAEVGLPDLTSWSVRCLRDADGQFAVTLFEDPDDAWANDPGEGLPDCFGVVIMIGFRNLADLPVAVQKEIASGGWTLASPDACPAILVVNTPAGGLSRELAGRATSVITALAAFAADRVADLESGHGGRPIRWASHQPGATVTFTPNAPFQWPMPDQVAAACSTGPGALPAAVIDPALTAEALARDAHRMIQAFDASLEAAGLKQQSVRRHVSNALSLLDYLVGDCQVPPAAATERDLRIFMYDWFPRQQESHASIASLRTSLRKFFAWLDVEYGIRYPWARPILDDVDSFAIRADSAPAPHVTDEQLLNWIRPVYLDLVGRLMVPSIELAGDDQWLPRSGSIEERLWKRLERSWMGWRDELIKAGLTDRVALRSALLERQTQWTRSPPAHGADTRSIRQIVLDERADRNAAESATANVRRNAMRSVGRTSGHAGSTASHDSRIWRLHVSIDGIDPPVWRRLEVSGNVTLRQLHYILQHALGWSDAHLHRFQVADQSWGEPDPEGWLDFHDDQTTRLSDIADTEDAGVLYHYDFGDSWKHSIVVERIFTVANPLPYPRLLDGERACPPEDCGGVWGYQELLGVLDDPAHDQHVELLEWLGDDFDPESFDAAAADQRLAAFRSDPGDAEVAAHNVLAVLATLDEAAANSIWPAGIVSAARNLIEAHAAADPGEFARLRKPAVWAAAALHAAWRLAGPVAAPTATALADQFDVSTAAVAARSQTLRKHGSLATAGQRLPDDAAPAGYGASPDRADADADAGTADTEGDRSANGPRRGQLRLL